MEGKGMKMELNVWMLVAITILVFAYLLYIREIVKGSNTTSPNPISWTVWGLISFGFFLILKSTGATTLSCILPLIVSIFQLVIAGACYYKRHRYHNPINSWEKLALILGLVAVILWYFLQGTYLYISLVCLTIGDICALIPSIKNAWDKPEEDSPVTWIIFLIVTILALIGMRDLSWVNLLYPTYEMIIALAMASILFFRRQHKESLEN